MKKIGLFVLCCAVALALGACASGGSSSGSASDSGSALADSKYVGTWQIDTISFKDESDQFSKDWTITLNADGTGSTTSEGVTDELTWSLTKDGFKAKGGINADFTDDGDGIATKILGASLHFNKVE